MGLENQICKQCGDSMFSIPEYSAEPKPPDFLELPPAIIDGVLRANMLKK